MTVSSIVLVGVDGSPESGAALKYAVAEANRRGARLCVVSTYFPEYAVHGRTQSLTASEPAIEVDVEAQTGRMVEEALAGDDRRRQWKSWSRPDPPRECSSIGPARSMCWYWVTAVAVASPACCSARSACSACCMPAAQ